MGFKAILLTKDERGFQARVTELDDAALGDDGEVVVDIEYTTLNYKDALALTDASSIVRVWPMVPGVDGAGVVRESTDARFAPGQRVVVNGWGLSERRWGCMAQRARLRADWLMTLPGTISTREAMAIGTAGYTAALAVERIVAHGVRPGDGEILVTGATGGVGSIAILLLAAQGYKAVAATGKAGGRTYLFDLGAAAIVDRRELAGEGKPLQKERWVAVIDTVGSHTLANACAQTRHRGIVAACGLAQGMDFPGTVAPFILRGVTLAGIESVVAPMVERQAAWRRLVADLDLARLNALATTIPLSAAGAAARHLLAGQVSGRYVIDVNAQ
jgi:acrylyl-CoA reductase (NADPH)